MLLTPDGKHLYVACANSTKVSVLDAATAISERVRAWLPDTPNIFAYDP